MGKRHDFGRQKVRREDSWSLSWHMATMVETANIVRWTEPIWDNRRRRKRAFRVGTRKVLGELLTLSNGKGWVPSVDFCGAAPMTCAAWMPPYRRMQRTTDDMPI